MFRSISHSTIMQKISSRRRCIQFERRTVIKVAALSSLLTDLYARNEAFNIVNENPMLQTTRRRL